MTIEEYLDTYCDEISPLEFYRFVFPEGSLEKHGEYVEGEYTAIAIVKDSRTGKFKHRMTMTDDLDLVDELCHSDDFCLMAPVSYAGKRRTNENARYLYAMAIDVDGVDVRDFGRNVPEGMWILFHQFDGYDGVDYLPVPTFIVSSGTGIHLYYVFEKPIALYKDAFKQLYGYKHKLTEMLWTQGVSTKHDDVQYESLTQGFRMPGTITKSGDRARAFMVGSGKKVSMDYMNSFVPEKDRTTVDFKYQGHLTLAKAKEMYPEWYQKRVVEGKPKGTWTCKRDLYEWWKRKEDLAKEGHRYWYVMTLAVYAKKSGISYEELEQDAKKMIPFLNAKGDREKNPFTEDDVDAALKAYNDDYMTYPIDAIVARTDIPIEKNKRNYRKQDVHLRIARATRDILHPEGWQNKNGRPTVQEKVEAWKESHPEGTKAECIRETGLSKPSVYKWWSS